MQKFYRYTEWEDYKAGMWRTITGEEYDDALLWYLSMEECEW